MSDAQLPSGWESKLLSEVANINPRLDKKLFVDELEVSFVPMSAVGAEDGQVDISEVRKFGDVKKGYTAFQEKDVLFAKITPCMENGKMAVVPKLKNNLGLGSTEFHVLRPLEEVLPEYIYYFVSSKQFRADAEHNMTGAVGQRRVPTTYFQKVSIPLPKYDEQKKIVVKIEELFSELDSGIASLKTAQEQLKIYRQSLLKHAFEGKLTEQWRKDNADKIETPEQLLARIQQERENRYQQQLEEWKQEIKAWEAKGKEGKKPSKPRKFKEVELNNYSFNKHWLTVDLGGISNVTGGLTKNQKRNSYDIQIPYLRVANVYANELRLDEVKAIGVTAQERGTIFLEKNDLLIVEGNGSIEQIGRVALWNDAIQECGHQNHLIRARLHNVSYAKLILYFLLSPAGRDFIIKEASSTSGLHTLSLTKVSNILVPVMTQKEADELVAILEEKLSIIDQNEKEIENALAKAELLRQSILKKAFSGELNSQKFSNNDILHFTSSNEVRR